MGPRRGQEAAWAWPAVGGNECIGPIEMIHQYSRIITNAAERGRGWRALPNQVAAARLAANMNLFQSQAIINGGFEQRKRSKTRAKPKEKAPSSSSLAQQQVWIDANGKSMSTSALSPLMTLGRKWHGRLSPTATIEGATHLSRTRCDSSPEERPNIVDHGDPVNEKVMCQQGKHRFESWPFPCSRASPPQKKTFNCRAPFSSMPTKAITREEAVKRSIHGRQARMLIDRAADRSTRAAVFPLLSVSGPFSITTPLFLSVWIDLRW